MKRSQLKRLVRRISGLNEDGVPIRPSKPPQKKAKSFDREVEPRDGSNLSPTSRASIAREMLRACDGR